jgi:peptide deformylase
MKVLKLTRFGNPILRTSSRTLSIAEIKSDEIQQFIANIRYTNTTKKYGLGIAAPQVGVNIALSLIDIKPTKTRPDVDLYEQIIINPRYEGVGRRVSMWEGCLSTGVGKHTLFAKTLRYKHIRAEWYDEHAIKHTEELSGIPAHVFQHETDHLSGRLFVDYVRDPSTYTMADEYRKRIAKKQIT